ncbi:hypothetical protein M5K25_024315 [Dendrobium thyrsiflorum]|uniref:Uncharacterized protein n=1 Tax=Dendrobium thyrsiflorum TaxID=117978 RepID=A0ABD0U230_DENTH
MKFLGWTTSGCGAKCHKEAGSSSLLSEHGGGSAIALSVRGIPFASLEMRNDHGGSAKVLGARGIPLASLRLLNCFISSHTYYHFSISDMAITKDEGRLGGKFFKRPLWRLPSTPYDRPPSALSRPQPANEAGRSGWFSKLVDSAAQIIVKGVPPLFSSVFGKGVASTPDKVIKKQ